MSLVTSQLILAAAATHIYVYADPHAPASSWQPVSLDGEASLSLRLAEKRGLIVAKIKRGTFFAITVIPGRHVFQIAGGTPTVIGVQPNRDVFLRLDEHLKIGEPKVLLLTPVTPEVARKEMRFLSYIPAKKILSANVSAADPGTIEEPKLKTRGQNE